MSRFTILAASVLALGLTLGLSSLVGAQYDPSDGTVSLATNDTTPAVGDQVTITAVVQDENGVALDGVECALSVAEQPGSGAELGDATVVTDADGQATTTLNTGDAGGNIVVEAVCGDLSAQVTIAAGAAAPPASLPDTGGGGTPDGGGGWMLSALVAAAAVAVICATTLAWRRMRA